MTVTPLENPVLDHKAARSALRVDLRSKSFADQDILRSVAFDLSQGETLVLCGPSGVGKSTLLRVISGLDQDYEGTIDMQGTLSMVFQEPTLLPWVTVAQNLTLTTGATDGDVMDMLASVGLSEKSSAYPNDLSLGQQRRLALARAFVVKPDILLMDEPFVSLDAALSDEIMSVFEKLRSDTDVATILVTHSAAEADRLGDRILTLEGAPATIVG